VTVMTDPDVRRVNRVPKDGTPLWRACAGSVALFLVTLGLSIVFVRPWLEASQRWLNERLSHLPTAALAAAFILPSLIVIGYTLLVWLRSKVRK
jgi:hypothetical protein